MTIEPLERNVSACAPVATAKSTAVFTAQELLAAQALLRRMPVGDAVVEMILDLVRACRYPPDGMRGVGAALGRASQFNAIADYVTTANHRICLPVTQWTGDPPPDMPPLEPAFWLAVSILGAFVEVANQLPCDAGQRVLNVVRQQIDTAMWPDGVELQLIKTNGPRPGAVTRP